MSPKVREGSRCAGFVRKMREIISFQPSFFVYENTELRSIAAVLHETTEGNR